jgi:hypothetical protein
MSDQATASAPLNPRRVAATLLDGVLGKGPAQTRFGLGGGVARG